ncbi:NAD-dependent epimerase/dehydratase family protein [Winogradskyella forsetii]|uniref:NAD-dependent epimerase/dehydratase family protein n=1 Tax=Winogradskyella forsetii TaxID=2686077 RepID=UPI0015BEAAD1|nr:GDP-mannose 4,6-dehydratase [Winogradskyella forsetii]
MDINYLKDKKIIVTGGEGFLGSKLIEKLRALDAMVFSFDITAKKTLQSQHVVVDITNKEDLKKQINKIQPDFIFHLAAKLNRSRDFDEVNEISGINYMGTINLLNALKEVNFTNFIFTSTSEVYGLHTNQPYKETDNTVAASPYSLSKLNAENAIKTFSNIYKKNHTILRLFNFYGEGMPSGFFISDLVKKLKKNEDFDMTLGEQERDFLTVECVLEALILSTQKIAQGNTYNVCSGNGIKIKDLAERFKTHLNSSSKINFGKLSYRNNEIWKMIGDNTKITKELGWKPKGLFE